MTNCMKTNKGSTTNWLSQIKTMSDDQLPVIETLADEFGVAIQCSGNSPLNLTDSQYVWFVKSGAVDLFTHEHSDSTALAAPQHLLRAAAGRILFSVMPDRESTTLSVIGKGLPGTVLYRIESHRLGDIDSGELADQIDAWIVDFSNAIARYDTSLVRADTYLNANHPQLESSGIVSTKRGVLWASGLTAQECLYLGWIQPDNNTDHDDGKFVIPLTHNTWISLPKPQNLTVYTTKMLVDRGSFMTAVAQFNEVVLVLERLNRGLAVADQVNVERERIFNRKTDENEARHQLFDLYGLSSDASDVTTVAALSRALEVIGDYESIKFNYPKFKTDKKSSELLTQILDASGVRSRRVRLDTEDKWWKTAGGAMLAFRKDDGQPVALIPKGMGRYRAIDPASGSEIKVDEAYADTLRSEAWYFYCPLPNASTSLSELFRLASKRLTADFTRFVFFGLLNGLVLLLPAVALGLMINEAIPNAEHDLVYIAGISLAVVAALGASVHVLQGFALMRIEGRTASRAEAAFWDRLLQMPPKLLQQYPAGELAMRGMSFQMLRDAIQAFLANGALTIIFLMPVSLLVLLYDYTLGMIAIALSLASFTGTVILGLRQVVPHGELLNSAQAVTGRLYQLINGISVLRLSGAEGSAFAVWARTYRDQKNAEIKQSAAKEYVQTLSAISPAVAGAVLLGAAMLLDTTAIGDFIVVFTVLMVFQGALVRFGASFSVIAGILPTLKKIQPFLAEPPETGEKGASVESLSGDIRLDHVSFRYSPDSSPVLDDVSIQVRPGQFVAITGVSGSGKSTLFKLMLGLEKPTTGAVYYDNKDLRHLNLKQVRRKIGAIPQTAQLLPDDIWDNIVGGNDNVTGDEVWDAARLACVDQDIEAMPMKMFTCVGGGVSVTSGGESQRVIIARALLNKPDILMLDEATNWLDNDNQARIMENLTELRATRIVIAHRLSTLQNADLIYVLDSGKVIETGTYDELIERQGLFHDLVQRQQA